MRAANFQRVKVPTSGKIGRKWGTLEDQDRYRVGIRYGIWIHEKASYGLSPRLDCGMELRFLWLGNAEVLRA